MPELPEVETTVRDLSEKIIGRKIVDVFCDSPNLIKKPSSFASFKKEITGKKILDIQRRGKYILFFLSHNKVLIAHQKLTGHFLYGKWKKEKGQWIPLLEGALNDPMNKFIHLVFVLDNGWMLALSDLRKFARIELIDKEEFKNHKELNSLGPDALDPKLTPKKFVEIVASKKRPIKQVLMDQTLIAGIGNIYSDEALFDAGIHPLRKANELSNEELKKLFNSIKKVLKRGLETGGESISDYRHIDGTKGNFDKYRKVYRREGEKCKRCGALIQRKKLGQRSTYFCPNCQK